MKEQEKLNILIGDFGKLDESRKDYIRELTRELADIHSNGKFGETASQNKHYGKGVFV